MKKHNIFHYLVNFLITLIKSVIFFALWSLIALAGYFIIDSQNSPYNVMLGIPLFIIGIGLAMNDLWNLVLDVISWRFNRETCILCRDE